jgi:hypothetical protein
MEIKLKKMNKFKRCGERTCKRRNILLSISNFYKHKSSKYGRRAICKECYHKRYDKNIEAQNRRRKYLIQSLPNTLTEEQREQVRKDFNYTCAITKRKENVQLDHFVPLSWGKLAIEYGIGGTTYANMLPLNKTLNKSKSSENPFEWIEGAKTKFNIDMSVWNKAVEYIANKHDISPAEFQNRVNECFNHLSVKRVIKYLNKLLNMNKRPPYFYVNSLLKQGINIEVAVEKFGNKKAKQFLKVEETQNYIKKAKEKLALVIEDTGEKIQMED